MAESELVPLDDRVGKSLIRSVPTEVLSLVPSEDVAELVGLMLNAGVSDKFPLPVGERVIESDGLLLMDGELEVVTLTLAESIGDSVPLRLGILDSLLLREIVTETVGLALNEVDGEVVAVIEPE